MGWYKKLAFNLQPKIISYNVVVNSFRNPIPRTNHPLFHTVSSPIRIRCGIQKDHRLSPSVSGVARRYYRVTHSPGGGCSNNNGSGVGLTVFGGVLILFGFCTISLYKRFETVPFTNRTRYVFWSHRMEKFIGEICFENHKPILYKGKTLPATHPQSVRVTLIAENIINGLQSVSISGKDDEKKAWIDVSYASDIPDITIENNFTSWFKILMVPALFTDNFWAKDDEAAKVRWVQNCWKKGKWKKPTINHLKAFNWEILLLNDCTYFASFTFPAGKIVMCTQFLENDTTDDEIAAILAHEIAHVLARHFAEKMMMYVWVDIIEKIQSLFGLDSTRTESLISFSRKVEVEADYIGLLLMASAGYDPRAAPKVYKKLGGIHCSESQLDESECRFAGPSGEERARLLAQPKVMEEAMLMYHEATAGRRD